MNCLHIKKLLSEYIDDYLDINTKVALEDHLLACAKCSGIYNELKILDDMLCSIKPIEASEADIRQSLEGIYKGINTTAQSINKIIAFPNLNRRKKSFKTVAVAASIILAVTVYFAVQKKQSEPVAAKLAVRHRDTSKIISEDVVSEPKQIADKKKTMEMAFWVNYQTTEPAFAHAADHLNIKFTKVIKGIGDVGYRYDQNGNEKVDIYDSLAYLNDLNKQIQSKIKTVDGKILQVKLETEPPYIEAEIPITNFESFSLFMDKIGDTQRIIPHNISDESLSAIDKDNDRFIQVRITINVSDY